MQINYRFGYLAALLVVCAFGLAAKTPATFTMPSSVLLFANPYVDLRIVTPDRVRVLEPPVKLPVNGGTFHAPSLSPKGDLIAWGLAVANDPLTGHVPGHLGRFALCIYSIADQRWKTYGDFDYIGDSAFSPDGSRIAL